MMLAATPAGRAGLWALFVLVVGVIYTPILTMIVFSFNSSRFQTLPFRNPTLDWYRRIAADPQYAEGLANSLLVAGSASLAATAIAFGCAYALVRSRFPGRTAVLALVSAPIAVPLVLIGLSLRVYALSIGLKPSLPLVVLGETIYVMPLAVMTLRTRIAEIPVSREEAAWSLGAGRWRAVLDVVLPSAAPAIVASFILCFTFAFDEFVIAYFLTNFEILLSTKIWTTLVTGFDPTVNAVGTMVLVVSLTLGITAQLVGRRGRRGGAPA
jgi:spermidine/putrescine transport system permease protein